MYSAMDIAQYIITYANSKDYSITNLRLQKLLFFVFKQYAKQYDKYLFNDQFLAWEFGPAIAHVYKEFADYIHPIKIEFQYMKKLDPELQQLINDIVDEYIVYPIDHLIMISTKAGGAWELAFVTKTKEIKSEDIKNER